MEIDKIIVTDHQKIKNGNITVLVGLVSSPFSYMINPGERWSRSITKEHFIEVENWLIEHGQDRSIKIHASKDLATNNFTVTAVVEIEQTLIPIFILRFS